MNKQRFSLILITSIIAIVMVFTQCSREGQKPIVSDPDQFTDYIAEHTTGIISKKSPVVIALNDAIEGEIVYEEPVNHIVSVHPEIEGNAYFVNRKTIVFEPEEAFSSGIDYYFTVNLAEVYSGVSESQEEFVFNVKTKEQFASIRMNNMSAVNPEDLTEQYAQGILQFNDWVDSSEVVDKFNVKQGGEELPIHITPKGDNSFSFEIDKITRTERTEELIFDLGSLGYGISINQNKTVEVPSLSTFSLLSAKVIQEPDQYVILTFSDPLKADQNFEGLAYLSGGYDATYMQEGSQLTIFPNVRLNSTKELTIKSGLKNSLDKDFGEDIELDLYFEDIKPNIRFTGEGTIIPSETEKVVFPFEAVNLSKVDVEVEKVYADNVLQFLQVNRIDGSYQMNRVGRKVAEKTIDLPVREKKNPGDWNLFKINLSDIVSVEAGAIYRVNLTFRKEYSLYGCAGDEDISTTSIEDQLPDDKIFSGWSERDWYNRYWQDDWYSRGYRYNYRERDNPCDHSYYRYKNFRRNVLASNLGVIAKAGEDKKLHVFVSDINDVKLQSNVKVEAYDYQLQLLGSARTDTKGMAEMYLEEKPFVLVAKKGNDVGYLRLRDGDANSLSKFDVRGVYTQAGLKGFIYGERGVWRPGDSIYTTFILEDREAVLPYQYPVVFELYDPKGVRVDRQIRKEHKNGFYDFRTATDRMAPTGNYLAKVKVGSKQFTKSLKVETVKPNRLKVNLDFGGDLLTVNQSEVTLNSRWLHGAIAKNLKARVEMTLRGTSTRFEDYEDFTFSDPTRRYTVSDQVVFDGQLNAEGNATFDLGFSEFNEAPGMLQGYFTTKIFEKGGGFSIARNSCKVSPYSSYVGLQVPKGSLYRGTLKTGENHDVDIVNVDTEGKLINENSRVEVELYQLNWRWWWDSYDHSLGSYIARSSIRPIDERTVILSRGKGTYRLRVEEPRYGRFLVLVKNTETNQRSGKIIYMDWPENVRASRRDKENATMLTFTMDKEKYNTGDEVELTIPSSSETRALVSVENGTSVVKKFWVDLEEESTKVSFSTTEEMAPNAYVHVTLLQPHDQTVNDVPIRMYGVMPLFVHHEKSKLHPEIETAEVFRPEEKATVKVSEADGRPMTYTLAVVDDGLLDLTSFKTPDPWNHFYAREGLGVKTWDIYDEVMSASALEMQQILAVGGGAGEVNFKGAKANRFEPVVKFLGPFTLAPGATDKHSFEMPNYVGSVRVMVVSGYDRAYGNAEKTVPVKNPLMVLGTMPRVVGPDEFVSLPVNVFAMEDHVKNVDVTVEGDNLLRFQGKTSKSIRFNKTGDEVVYFDLKVARKTGVGKVKITAKSGNETATYEVEVDVRSANQPMTDIKEGMLMPGENWEEVLDFNGIEGTMSAALEVSSTPPLNLEKRLRYLIRYPHGCLEQTTSSAFPQLALDGLMDLDKNYKKVIGENIDAAIHRISRFQNASGGFAYWPGNTNESDWGTNYAGHFLITAKKKGYHVPSGLLNGWVKYQKNRARTWSNANTHDTKSHYGQLTQAYRLYTLALYGQPDLAAMNRMREMSLSASTKWRLAGAYAVVGHKSVAQQIINGESVEVSPYRDYRYTYGSHYRDEAMILEVTQKMDLKNASAKLAKRIAERLGSSNWMSTQEVAYSLLALEKFYNNYSKDGYYEFNRVIAGERKEVRTNRVVYQQVLNESHVGKKVALKNTGESPIFVRLVVNGIPLSGFETDAAENMSINVDYLTMEGSPIDPSTIEQGTDFMARVQVKNPGYVGYLDQLSLTQVFPSGWEIHNTRMDQVSGTWNLDSYDYQDIRDHRVYTYYSLANGQSKTFYVKLNAAYKGKYYLPATITEAMYDGSVYARKKGNWVEVVGMGEKNTAME